MMKSYFKIQLLVFAFVAILFASCQSEENEVSEPNPENLTASSPMTTLLRRVSMEDVFSDNSIDSTACYKLKLPVDVIVNGQQNTIATVDDYPIVAAILNGSNSDIDSIEFVFPITVIATNGTEILVSSQSQFDELTENCQEPIENDEPINCIGINYPVTIFKYDPNFQVSGTSIISNDADLLLLLMNLSIAEYYAISYPISVTNGNGQIVEINNNQELMAAIDAAIVECNTPIDPCFNPQVLTNGLIIYMPFASEARDLVSMNFAINNDNYPPLFVADRNGTQNSAVSFGGSEYDHLKILATEMNNVEPNDSLTISIWFKLQNSDQGNQEYLFGKLGEFDDGFYNTGFYAQVYDANTPNFTVPNNNSVWDTSWQADNLQNDTTNWHHLVITTSRIPNTDNHTVKIYRDGVERNTNIFSNPYLNTQFLNYFIGKNFKGHLDDLRVYRRTLAPQEVQILYNLEGDNNTCLQ